MSFFHGDIMKTMNEINYRFRGPVVWPVAATLIFILEKSLLQASIFIEEATRLKYQLPEDIPPAHDFPKVIVKPLHLWPLFPRCTCYEPGHATMRESYTLPLHYGPGCARDLRSLPGSL